jgi:hypothetical protein
VNATEAAGPRPSIRLGFTGFWDIFDLRDNSFTRLLARHYVLIAGLPSLSSGSL